MNNADDGKSSFMVVQWHIGLGPIHMTTRNAVKRMRLFF